MTNEITKSTEKNRVGRQGAAVKLYGRGKSRVQKGLVYAAAVITFAVLLFLIAYILINGIPNLKPSLFEWTYNSDKRVHDARDHHTVEMTLLALVIAVPLGLFTAIYLNEYAKRGNKLVTSSASRPRPCPAFRHCLRPVRHAVLCHPAALGLLADRRRHDACDHDPAAHHAHRRGSVMAVPDTFREGSFGLGAGRLRTVFRIVLPSAMPGILSGIILAIAVSSARPPR